MEIFSSLAKGALDIPFVVSAGAHVLGTRILTKFATAAQKTKYLPSLLTGETVIAICNSEHGAGTNIKNMKSSVVNESVESGIANIKKSMANNLPIADVVIASAWRITDSIKPLLDVFLIDLEEKDSQSVVHCLGFRTGAVGRLEIKNKQLVMKEVSLGKENQGGDILKYCFDLERFFMSVLLYGSIAGMLEEAIKLSQEREAFGKPIGSFQYTQEKIIRIYQAKETLGALIQKALNERSPSQVDEFPSDDATLSLLKFYSVEEAHAAAICFFELCGGQGYQSDHIAQKMIRDILGLKALGGTKEQHKMTIFSSICKKSEEETGDRQDEVESVKTA